MREVVVTGMGLVSSIGGNVDEFEVGLFSGKSGVRNIRGSLVAQDFPVPYAAWIPREELPETTLFRERNPCSVLKSWLLTEQATFQALEGLDPYHGIDSVVYGTADGVSFELVERVLRNPALLNDCDALTTCSESSLNVVRDAMVLRGFRPVEDRHLISINSACATGNQAIGVAFQGIRSGRWTRCLVGGVDARCEPSNLLNFYLLGALTADDVPPEKASRPFSKSRSGFVRGEGAATLILESREAAEKRGAKILGAIRGYSCTSDAYRLTDGREDGASVIEAMRLAIADAGMKPEGIDYINAHGTSTPLNDRLETQAIKKVFGERAKSIPISSLKSQIGHSTIAASAIEAIASLLMLKNQRIAPTINLDEPDPECDLDFVPHVSREAKLESVLSNSFGFGGQNTCIVLTRGAQ